MNVDHVLLHIFTAEELALFAKLQVSQQYNDSLFYAPFWPSPILNHWHKNVQKLGYNTKLHYN